MPLLKAEVIVNGPKGQAFATVEVEPDGSIHPAYAEAALAHMLNIYNEMPNPKEFNAKTAAQAFATQPQDPFALGGG